MEFEKIFSSVAVVFIAIFAYLSLLSYWNVEYGQTVGSSFNNTYVATQNLAQTNLFNLSTAVGNNTNPPSGAGSISDTVDLLRRALRIITAIPIMIDLVPSLFQDAAEILDIPPEYVNIASYVFIFSFAVLFGYLLITGVRRLL